MIRAKRGSTVKDMTSGSIIRHIILFALPLMFGNVFQMLYNTVDSVVVGNFVGKQALAAIGSTTPIVNMFVFFFNGFSVGAGVVIGNYFGAHDYDKLHDAIETTVAATFALCAIFTAAGIAAIDGMLKIMDTPEDVFRQAALYLRIYIGGISGLLIYNVCSGILRAVGDSTRPLFFLILTSVMNIALDLAFVILLDAGIAGVAYATIISQFVSAALTLRLLTNSREVYRLTWRDLRIYPQHLKRIFSIGLPAGFQAVVTAFSNIFVQSYINAFGSDCMAGWSSYIKLDSFVMLPMQSAAQSVTTFVSQNIGAKQEERASRGTAITVALTVGITLLICTFLLIFAAPAIKLFSPDEAVIKYGVMFIRTNTIFFVFNCISHVLAGSLRGRGDSRGPMIIMLGCFVGVRQLYLYIVTRFIANTARIVGFGYPVGWMSCAAVETVYYLIRMRKQRKNALT